MSVFEESYLRFEFSDEWTFIEQYDKQLCFNRIRDSIQGTKGVDFVGILNNSVYFFELKNFKQHRIEFKYRFKEKKNSEYNTKTEIVDRKKKEPIWLEVARKVRDTIAGIIGGNRKYLDIEEKEKWQKVVEYLINPKKDVVIVFWLEQDEDINEKWQTKKGNNNIKRQRWKVETSNTKKKLKQCLSWLNPKIIVANSTGNYLRNTLKVTKLPKPPTP